jgi:hypothetical protein
MGKCDLPHQKNVIQKGKKNAIKAKLKMKNEGKKNIICIPLQWFGGH